MNENEMKYLRNKLTLVAMIPKPASLASCVVTAIRTDVLSACMDQFQGLQVSIQGITRFPFAAGLQVRNFGLFQEMIKTQKIMSPAFSVGDCSLRLSVYQSAVSGADYLSMCLESKDTDKAGNAERSCWCLFRMSVLAQAQGGRHMHRDSYGRFAADSKTGDNTRSVSCV